MARKNDTPQLSIDTSAPVTDPGRAPTAPPEAKERQDEKEDPNAEPRAKDRVYDISSRARWGGTNASNLTEMQADAKRVESGETEEEEEEEEEADASQLTVPQLKEALDAAEVEYAAGAKKPALVALYNEHNLGG